LFIFYLTESFKIKVALVSVSSKGK
jgi:hypothetical protein